jgi:ribosomal protein S18 acetylase RimI-like enzyme
MSSTSGAVIVRPCRLDEVGAVLALWQEAEATPSPTDTEADLLRAVNGPALVLVAEAAGRLVGSVIGGFDGWRANLYRLAVRPEHRRRGIARALVAEAERRLAQRGARRVTALVERNHPWATGFWEAVGYARDERMARHVRNLQ